MSCGLENLTACVKDNGFFLPVARRLAKDFKRVLFVPTWEKSYPVINEGCIGDGFPDIECCHDLWEVKDEVDVFVFPDIGNQGMQRELRSQGYPVWGSGPGMMLETSRGYFLETLKKLGLDVPLHEKIVGVSNLSAYLRDKKDIYIKMSKWRGSWETKHWRSWKEDAHHIDAWAVKFGGIKDKVIFHCFPAIETDLEIGADTYCIDGEWPHQMLHGIESKDEAYFAAVTNIEDMPEELTHIMEAFSPMLKDISYRCQWSMEARVTQDASYFIDATCRGGLPSTSSQLLAMKNISEVIYHGACGEMEQPQYEYLFTAECMVKIKSEPNCWEPVVIPDELKDHMLSFDCCEVDGVTWFPSDENKSIEEIGWLCAYGNTPEETAKEMNRIADLLPDGADACVESLSSVIREVTSEQDQGIHFTDKKMPRPEVVLEPSK